MFFSDFIKMKLLALIVLIAFAALAVQAAPEPDAAPNASPDADPFFFPFFGGFGGGYGRGWGRRGWGWGR